jgi:acyl-CoA thioesterase-1
MAGPCPSDISKRLLLLLVLWLPLSVPAADTVLVLGDSLSAAHGIEQKQGWVSLLQERLHQLCAACRVINASVSGETTAGGRSRLVPLLERDQPDILIVELGGNDGLRGLPLDQMSDNLGAMIDAAQTRGVTTLLVGMRLPANYGPAYTRKFHAVYLRLAEQRHVALVPFLLAGLEDRRDLFQADGIHPTAAAQQMLLDNVWPTLKAMLRDRR